MDLYVWFIVGLSFHDLFLIAFPHCREYRTRIAELEASLTSVRRERDAMAEEMQKLKQRVQDQVQQTVEVRLGIYHPRCTCVDVSM